VRKGTKFSANAAQHTILSLLGSGAYSIDEKFFMRTHSAFQIYDELTMVDLDERRAQISTALSTL